MSSIEAFSAKFVARPQTTQRRKLAASRPTLPVAGSSGGLIPGSSGTEEQELDSGVNLRGHRPSLESAFPMPGLVWMHGGGYVIGAAAQTTALSKAFAARTGAVVVSVD